MSRTIQHVLAAMLLMLGSAADLLAEERFSPTADERKKALELIEGHDVYKQGETTRRVLCQLDAFKVTGADKKERRLIVAYHFEYTGAITIKSVVDVDEGKVVEAVRLEGYAPPLSVEERQDAVRLVL